jgi:ATP-binding cassette subfamily C protein CydCD
VKPLDPRLLRYARRARLPIAGMAALGALAAGLVIIQAQLLATAIAGAFADGASLAALTGAIIALALVVAGRAAAAWAGEAVAHLASAAAIAELRQRLLARALALGPSWLAGQRTASLTALATTGVDGLEGYFTGYLPALFLAAVVPVAVLARIAVADPWSGLVIGLTLPLVPLFGALIGLATARHARMRWQALGALASHFHDVVAGLATLKVFGRAGAQRESIERVTGQYRRATMGTLRLAFLSAFALELIATTSIALVAVEIGLRLAAGSLDLKTGLLALILAPEAYLPLRAASAQFHASADGLAAAQEAFAILEDPGPGAGAVVAGAVRGEVPGQGGIIAVSVSDLRVAHEGRARPAPDGVSLTITPGRITALAGPSGCGKSTLVSALLGFTRPDAGRILITARGCPVAGEAGPREAGPREAGVRELDVRELDHGGLGWWRAQAGWVPQEPALFPGTVAANIRLGWPQAPQDAVREAARAAALDDVPLEAALGDQGTGLSAGQRRRVALARALLPRPDGCPRPVLLLDEPTAGLDQAREERVIATLRAEAASGRAILIVSHHPAVLAAADEVVFAASPVPGGLAASPAPGGPAASPAEPGSLAAGHALASAGARPPGRHDRGSRRVPTASTLQVPVRKRVH